MGHAAPLLTRLRRRVTRWGVRAALNAGRWLPIERMPAALGIAAGAVIPLRRQVERNLRAALGKAPIGAADRYFDRLGHWATWSISVYHRGFWNTPLPRKVELDDSVVLLDDAARAGRGAVLAVPHFFAYDLGAAFINQRHPIVGVIRQSKEPDHQAIKERWYAALGLETLLRPRVATTAEDMAALVAVLRGGKFLGITPDVLVPAKRGVAITMFGRRVMFSPGAVLLAIRAGCPLIGCMPRWTGSERAVLAFRPIELPKSADLEEKLRAGLEDWCGGLEAHLRRQPEDWQFWLDKRWTRALECSPDAPAEEKSSRAA